MTEPLTAGPQAGKAVDPAFYNEILDAYYRHLGWTASGIVGPERLRALGIPTGRSPA
jgi:aldehyde:ferredoxin oxidoreductase